MRPHLAQTQVFGLRTRIWGKAAAPASSTRRWHPSSTQHQPAAPRPPAQVASSTSQQHQVASSSSQQHHAEKGTQVASIQQHQAQQGTQVARKHQPAAPGPARHPSSKQHQPAAPASSTRQQHQAQQGTQVASSTSHSGTIKHATSSLPSRDLLAFLHEKTKEVLLQQSDILNQARLRAFAAPWADGWLRATPSMAADSLLQSEVRGWVCPCLMEVGVQCAHMRAMIVDTIV